MAKRASVQAKASRSSKTAKRIAAKYARPKLLKMKKLLAKRPRKSK